MNDDRELNEEELLLATSRYLAPGAALHAESAALREGFLALGSSLESAGGPLDDAALIELLRERTATDETQIGTDDVRVSSMSVRADVSPKRDRLGEQWLLVAGCALAAAALIAIVRIAMAPGVNHAAIPAAMAPADAALSESDWGQPAPLEDAWHDPLDDEIALAAATMGQLGARAPGFDESLFDVNQELLLLSQELAGESL